MRAASPGEDGTDDAERTLVAGIGNLFLGDDGFGPEVVRRLSQADLPAGVRVVDYGIRGMHLAYDLLDGCDRAGAGRRAAGPRRARAPRGAGDPAAATSRAARSTPHGMDPVPVLASLGALGGDLPPTTLVGVQVADVSERIGLSPVVEQAVPAAADAVRRLLAQWLPAARTQEVG